MAFEGRRSLPWQSTRRRWRAASASTSSSSSSPSPTSSPRRTPSPSALTCSRSPTASRSPPSLAKRREMGQGAGATGCLGNLLLPGDSAGDGELSGEQRQAGPARDAVRARGGQESGEESGWRRALCRFMLPLGTTINMDGSALHQSIAVIYLAQGIGVPAFLLLSMGQREYDRVRLAGAPGCRDGDLHHAPHPRGLHRHQQRPLGRHHRHDDHHAGASLPFSQATPKAPFHFQALGIPTQHVEHVLVIDWLLDRLRFPPAPSLPLRPQASQDARECPVQCRGRGPRRPPLPGLPGPGAASRPRDSAPSAHALPFHCSM